MRLSLLGLALCACGGTCPPPDHASGHPGHGHGHGHGHGMTHDFSDVGRFEELFDAPDRDGWQRPAEVVALLGAAPGQTLVDLGTGTGYFLPFLSVAAGAAGRVLALDAEPAMVEHVRRRAEREGLAHVEARAVTESDPGLEAASVDRILIVDTWHHLPDRAAYAARLRDALRPDGVILVVDFTAESPHGPPPEHRLAAEAVAAELEAAGLRTEIAEEGLPFQYAVRARR